MGDDWSNESWIDIDLKATEEELKEQVLQSTIATLKVAHPDDLHFHVLQKLLNTKHGSHQQELWAKILNRIQEED